MSGASIIPEVADALREAAFATGDGQPATLVRPNVFKRENPWDEQPQPPGAGDWNDDYPTGDDSFLPNADFFDGDAPPTEQPVWAISQAYRQDLIDGTLIRAEDRRVMIEAVTPAPTTADKLVMGGETFRIISVDPEQPGGVALWFTLQCRR